MDVQIVNLIALSLFFLLSGLIIGWKLCRKKIILLTAGLEESRVAISGLSKEKEYLLQQKDNLGGQLENCNIQLREALKESTGFSTRLTGAGETITSLKEDMATLKSQLTETKKELIQATNDHHRQKAQLQYKDEQLLNQKQQLEDIGRQFTKEFQLLAQKVLEEKTSSFHTVQEKSISDLLTPLKENLQTFKQEFETRYKVESDDRISLREQIKHMMLLNQTLSDQANNLTNALRGQVKQQGNWGEMILESILEYADLKKDIHYFVQQKSTGEEGQALLPDVVVRYPDGRSIVIDSKVSLLHYEQYCSAPDDGAQRIALNLMQQSVTRHIDCLSGKKYPDAVGALDFVLLFVPVEGAYITLMQANPQVWQYAYRKRVLLISPTNLIAAMKLVYDLWKREGINQNAQEVAEKAVRIYEKLAAFLEDFEKVGTQLEKAGNCFSDARKKLHTGKGNLLSTASQMKQKLHHTKPQRELPSLLMEEAEKAEEAV